MKILQITPYYLPHTGGIERYVANLSKYLVKNDHEVTIYTSNIPPSKKFEDINGIKIKRFFCLATPMRNPIVPAFFFPNLQEIKKYDIVQIHMIYSTAAICGCIIKLLTGKPLIFTHHGRMVYGETHRDIITHIFEKTIMKLLLKCADHCVVLSNSDKEFISGKNFNKEKIFVIPNGIETGIFDISTNLGYNDFIKKYNLENTIPLLFVGEITARKGLKYLIKAMDILINEYQFKQIKLLLIGYGDDFRNINATITDKNLQDYCVLLKRVPIEELISAYKCSKIFILPSLSEGVPTVIFEAMYFGLPVIATDIPGIRDYFSDTAILVPPRDPVCLGKAILYLMQNPDIGRELSRKGKEKVIKEFTWDKIVQQYLKLYNELQFNNKRKEDE